MSRRMRQAASWIRRAFFFAGVMALGVLGVVMLMMATEWTVEGFVGSGVLGMIAAVWLESLVGFLLFLTAPKLFTTWDRERAYEDAHRCVRCDRGSRPLFRVQGVDGAACKACLPFLQEKGEVPGVGPYAAARRARGAGL